LRDTQTAGMPQNAGVRGYLSEPRAPARKPILGCFPFLSGPLSLTQPNHGHFGTVVRSPPDQWVMRCQLGGGFESAALKRSEHGSNNSIRYGCRADRNRAPRGVAGADRRGARLGPSRERPPAEGPLCRASMGPSAGRLRRLVVHRSCEASRGVGHSDSCCGLPMCATGCTGMQSAVEAAGGSSRAALRKVP
jgi:hypothetical protein